MPALLVLDWNGRTSHDENDVIAVLPVAQHPGREVVRTTPRRFAFVYCTDIVPDGPLAQRLLEPSYGPADEAGNRPIRRRRRRRIQLTGFPGNVTRFTDYERWNVAPNNKKYTWAQLLQREVDKDA